MRVDKPTVREHAGGTKSNVETMRFIRTEKDNFKAKQFDIKLLNTDGIYSM